MKDKVSGYTSALELCDVTFSYGRSSMPAIEHVSLSVEPGQCVVVTGESGCGKTTLMRLMNGLIPAIYQGQLHGSVSILGRALGTWSMDELAAHVGSVFQDPRTQFVTADTTSEIAFGCESLGIAHDQIVEQVHEAADALGISDLLDRDVRKLSGGEKQLVILASAYAVHPDILVLDEPTASLDVRAMKRLAHVLFHLKSQGTTIIIAEHRLWWLADLADRVVLCARGRVSDQWSAEQFGLLEASKRSDMGLRAWRVEDMEPTEYIKKEIIQDTDNTRVDVQKLCVGYRRGSDILHELDFRLKAGRCVGLVGHNGAGKTTFARCMCGLLKERAGSIAVDGESFRWRERCGKVYLVMQETGYQLFSDTAYGELMESLARRNITGEKAHRLAKALQKEMGLQECAKRRPLSLSGGQRQRLSIAAGILYGADAMVLDEPTSGLDYHNMCRVARQVHLLLERGLGVCVISHDFEFVCEVCDDVALLKDGAIQDIRPLNNNNLAYIRGWFGF